MKIGLIKHLESLKVNEELNSVVMKSNLNLALFFLMTSALVWGQKSKEYKRINSIAYYDQSEVLENSYMQEMCVLDLYYPENLENFSTIIWFHGGGLTSGKREIPAYLKNKGVAVIGVGYRLSPKVKKCTMYRRCCSCHCLGF